MDNQKGFSLMELMVAVAIIAIVTLIGVPSYKSFQAKARQKEGFNMLNTFYTVAQSTHAEYRRYPGNLVATGFAPVGQLVYRLRSEDGNDLADATAFNNDDGCVNTGAVCNCGGNCPNFKTWNEPIVGSPGVIGARNNTGLVACPTLGINDTNDNDFIVRVGGWISTTAIAADVYGMNEQKLIEMCSDGLK